MLTQGCLLIVLVILQTYNCVPLQKEKIETVNLSSFCMRTQTGDAKHNKSMILLLHGLLGTKENWEGVSEVLALRTGRTVCAVDLRNHGSSPWNDRFDLPALTADISEFLDLKKIEKVNLISHSFGGVVAVHYALNNPGIVNSLVVEDMRPNVVNPQAWEQMQTDINILKEAMAKVPEVSEVDEAKKIIADFIRQKYKELGIKEEMDEKSEAGLPVICPGGKCQFIYNLNAIAKALENMENLFFESKGLYDGPTLFIYGTKSIFDVAGDKDKILKLFPKARLVGVEGADHQIHGIYKQFDDEVIRLLQPLN